MCALKKGSNGSRHMRQKHLAEHKTRYTLKKKKRKLHLDGRANDIKMSFN